MLAPGVHDLLIRRTNGLWREPFDAANAQPSHTLERLRVAYAHYAPTLTHVPPTKAAATGLCRAIISPDLAQDMDAQPTMLPLRLVK